MCEFCHTYPHLSGCPEAPEPATVHVCDWCKDSIYAGDECADIDGSYYHVSCLSDEMNIYELLDLFGVSCEDASEYD